MFPVAHATGRTVLPAGQCPDAIGEGLDAQVETVVI
jgi:hypothetical protein